MIELFLEYKYLITPFLIWFCIQTFKVIYDVVVTKKFNFKRRTKGCIFQGEVDQWDVSKAY